MSRVIHIVQVVLATMLALLMVSAVPVVVLLSAESIYSRALGCEFELRESPSGAIFVQLR